MLSKKSLQKMKNFKNAQEDFNKTNLMFNNLLKCFLEQTVELCNIIIENIIEPNIKVINKY